MRRPALPALLLVLGVTSAAPASAADATLVARTGPTAGPALAGERVLWSESPTAARAEGVAPDGSLLLRAAVPGQAASTLLRTGGERFSALAASATRVAVAGPGTSRRLQAGALGAPLDTLATVGPAEGQRPVAISDSAAAWVQRGPQGSSVLVRDLATAATTVVAAAAPALTRPRLAGRFAAWVQGQDTVVVYDRLAAAEAYRLALGPEAVVDFDLQDDGKVAALITREGRFGLRWASSAEPFPHLLPAVPAPPAGADPIDLAADRIAFVRAAGGGRLELALSALDGSQRALATTLPGAPVTGFAVGPDRFALAAGAPADPVCLYAGALGATGAAALQLPACPTLGFRVAAGSRLARGRLRVRASCPAAAAGRCLGFVSATVVPPGRTPDQLARASLSVPPGRTLTRSLRVRGALQRRLRRLGQLPVRLLSSSQDAAGGTLVASRRLTLRAQPPGR